MYYSNLEITTAAITLQLYALQLYTGEYPIYTAMEIGIYHWNARL